MFVLVGYSRDLQLGVKLSYTMEYWEKERIAQNIMILVIFITIVLTILVYFGKL